MKTLRRPRASKVLSYAILLIAALFTLFPIYWTLNSSLKTDGNLFSTPPQWFPQPFTLDHYAKAITDLQFGGYLKNSVVVALSTTAISLVIGLPAAYGFARFRFRMSKILFSATLVVRMFPPVVLMIPLFLWMRNLGLVDSYGALIIAYLPAQLTMIIWMMESFFEDVPQEIDDAGAVDGLGYVGRLVRLDIPLALPGIAVSSMLAFLSSWNEMLYALVLTRSMAAQTLPIGITGNIGTFRVDWGGMTAFGMLFLIPAIIFTAFGQRGMVRGLTAGAVKG